MLLRYRCRSSPSFLLLRHTTENTSSSAQASSSRFGPTSFCYVPGEGSRQPEFETGVALYLLSLMLMDSDSHPPARHAVKLANPAFFLTEMGKVSSQKAKPRIQLQEQLVREQIWQ